ncbi:hypothetical protein AWB75_04986 [Caballeronia catudaia]|uniref:Uncharacterized protein n=1 Tax=Caballeronia catudaia TaxID=1777136 RepID=A0A158CE20_9BURK|nr:hypothetical protein [Caballeronia catudaia]SAK80618.1 hypothetical protein AWB75_04986 [Caballeronia catudaia]
MNTRKLGFLFAASLIALYGEGAMANRAASRIEGLMVVQVIGEVKAVDASAHRVTVVNAQGVATQLNVSPDMQDLGKLPLGTRVKSSVLQPVTLTRIGHAKLQQAVPGDKRFVAQVASVDAATGVVMLEDADRLPIEVRARDARQAGMLASGATVRVDVVNEHANAAQKKP